LIFPQLGSLAFRLRGVNGKSLWLFEGLPLVFANLRSRRARPMIGALRASGFLAL